MNNEPVAWIDYLEHSDVYDLNVSGRGIPLYTTPQIKELSREEVSDCKKEAMEQFYKLITPQSVDIQQEIIDSIFAKALLKKASEK